MSSIKAIAIKNRSRAAMQSIDGAQMSVANGILGDLRGTQPGRTTPGINDGLVAGMAWRNLLQCGETRGD